MEFTTEQKKRINHCRVQLGKYMLQEKIRFCSKLYNSGEVSNAVEILTDYTDKTQTECLRILEEQCDTYS